MRFIIIVLIIIMITILVYKLGSSKKEPKNEISKEVYDEVIKNRVLHNNEKIQEYSNFLELNWKKYSSLIYITRKYIKYNSYVENENIFIGHRPWLAPENYIIIIYSGVSKDDVKKYEEKFNIKIPNLYFEILNEFNGLWAFDFALYGLPESMLEKMVKF